MNQYHFFALLSRLKYIERWALMRSSSPENLAEHSLEVAMIAHALCVIGNERYGRSLNAERAALVGMYHDASEIITGDMPTPVKYFNAEFPATHKNIAAINSDEKTFLNIKIPSRREKLTNTSKGIIKIFQCQFDVKISFLIHCAKIFL